MRTGLRAVGAALVLMMPVFAVAHADGLPEAPKWKPGKFKRSTGSEIILDRDAVDTRGLVPANFRKIGLGTGFFINGSGDVLTNSHVVDHCKFLTVEPVTGGIQEGVIAARDEGRDLALLNSAFRPDDYARFRPGSGASAGEIFRVVGYPTRTLPPLRPVLERVTFLSEKGERGWLVVKGRIYPGNSGGPAYDQYGRIAGVVVAKVNTPGVYQQTGELVEDVGFLISLSETHDFLGKAAATYERSEISKDYASRDMLERNVVKIGCWDD